MSNLLKLTKINLLALFNIKKNNKNSITKLFILLLGFLIFGYYIYDMTVQTIPGYITLNIPYIVIVQYFAITSSIILFTNIFKINGTLFHFRDYDLLMSLPIKKGIIILSKLVILYITNLLMVLIFMIPSYIVYVNNVSTNITFHILYFITLFIIPLVPIIISTIIGTIITSISSNFKRKNIINMIISVLLMFGIFYLSYGLENTSSIDIANIGKSMVNTFNQMYPLTNLYTDIITNNNIISLILFILIPIILFYTFILILNKFFNKINNKLSTVSTKNKYKLTKSHANKPIFSLYKKELKRYFSSSVYVLNTAIGPIMLTIAVFALVITGTDKIDTLIGIEGLAKTFKELGPLVLGAFCVLTCTTSSSISLEGKNLWIIKSLPIEPIKIFISKIMVNLTILIPTIIINATILSIYLKINIASYLLMLLTPIAYSLLISQLGILINIYCPIFDWKNEIRVIKQSMATILSLFIGFIIALIPFNISNNLDSNLYILIITFIIIILNLIIYILLNTVCTKKFKKL